MSQRSAKREQGWRSGESARLPPMCPGFDSRRRRHMWVEFVVGSLLCSERFFSGYSGFPLSSKTNISKFQFDLDVRHFSHEPLARVIAQALLVLDVKFTFNTFNAFKSHSTGEGGGGDLVGGMGLEGSVEPHKCKFKKK